MQITSDQEELKGLELLKWVPRKYDRDSCHSTGKKIFYHVIEIRRLCLSPLDGDGLVVGFGKILSFHNIGPSAP